MLRSRLIPAAAVSVAAVLTLSGCNGSESDQATEIDGLSPVAAIEKVADTAAKDSATYTFELAGSGISVKGSGAYAGGEKPAMKMAFDSMKMAGFSMPAGTEFRIVDDVMYLKSSKGGLLPGVGTDWVKLPLDEVKDEAGSNSSFSDLTMTNPAEQLKKMLDTDDVTKVGSEKVDGVSTTHYRATIDSAGSGTVVEKKSSDNQNELSRQLEEQLESSIKDSMGLDKPVTVDAWVDGDYHARKLMMTLPFMGEMTMTMKFDDFGKAVDVAAPADAKELDFGDLLGGAFGENFGKEFGDDFGKNFEDLFGEDFEKSMGDGRLSSDFSEQLQKQLREEIEKGFADHNSGGGSST